MPLSSLLLKLSPLRSTFVVILGRCKEIRAMVRDRAVPVVSCVLSTPCVSQLQSSNSSIALHVLCMLPLSCV